MKPAMTRHGPGFASPEPGRARFRRFFAALALCAAALMLPGYTFYEVQTEVGPIPLRWYKDKVDVYHDMALTTDAPASSVLDAINLSIEQWNKVQCEHPVMINRGPVANGSAFELNDDTNSRRGTNLIIFEDEATWDANRADANQWDSSLTLALTTVFHVASNGEVMNFALELNDSPFTFGIGPTGYAFDIQNTVTHELGHVLGLDHTTSEVQGWDQQTMYFQTEPAETIKRTLEDDDRAGYCYLYSENWKADVPDQNGSCSVSGGPVTGPAAAAALMVLMTLLIASMRLGASRRDRA